MEMKTNKYTGIGVLFLLALLVCPLALAATTTVAPIDNGNYTGTVDVNVTTALTHALNVSCLYHATGGVATISFIDIVNTSVSQTVFTGTVNVAAYTDSATYNVSCTANNAGESETATAITGITIDNTDPVVTLEVLLKDMTVSSGSVIDYKCAVTDAIDSGVSTTFNITDADSSVTSLTVGSSNFLNFVDTNTAGDYVFSCYGADYTGNSAVSTATVTIDELGRATITQIADSDSNKNMLIFLAIALLGLWLYYRE